MRKTVHLCLSSHDEVMCRCEADLIMEFNCLALACLETEARLLAEAQMTTHAHSLLQCDDYKETMHRTRYSYARYFNAKYCRKGLLGEREYFSLEVDGLHHTIAALDYVLRQGLHHGLSSTPFEYPHCSANAFFRKSLGKVDAPPLMPQNKRYLYLPGKKHLDCDRYRMSAGGLLLRQDILDTAYVEEIYLSPRTFLFHMNKISGEGDLQKQLDENGDKPVTVETIEAGVPDFDAKNLKILEQGKVDRSRMTDLELCSIIDNVFVPRFFKGGEPASIYLLSQSQRAKIYDVLWQECLSSRFRPSRGGFLQGKYITGSQLERCLCLHREV